MSVSEGTASVLTLDEKRARLARMLQKRAAQPRYHPLSFAQQRLWFLDRLQPGNPAYNVATIFSFYGPVVCWAFEAAVREIVRRHQTLRTRFALVDGQPVQIVNSETAVELSILDLRPLPGPRRIVEMRRFLNNELFRGFDLSRAPILLRILLVRMEDEGSAVVVSMPHIVSDGWSLGIVMRELSILYPELSAGRPSPLPELPIQYVDFAAWQRQWLRGATLEIRLDYWRRRLAGATGVLELATDRPRPPVQTFRGGSRDVIMPRSTEEALLALASRQGATLFMVLVAAFLVLLHRYTLQEDISIGVPTAGRTRKETEDLIGLFTNTLVLRGELGGEPAFSTFLEQVRESSLGAVAHQDMPFEKLVEELQPARDTSRSPLFQVAFVLQNLPTFQSEQRSLALGPGVRRETAKFEMTLEMAETDLGLVGVLEYNRDLFDGSTVERMGTALSELLTGIAEAPDLLLGDFPLLPEGLRQQILAEWNASAPAALPQGRLHALFESQARACPDTLAAVHRHERLTYGELDCRAAFLARRLRSLGVGPETRVAVCAERSLDLLVGLLGALKAGGAYVPVDPMYPMERKTYLLEDSRAEVLVTQGHLLASLPPHPRVVLLEDEQLAAAADETPARVDPLPGNLAYVIYTSGSTGQPKGVGIEHRSASAMVHWAREAFSPAEFAGVLAATSVCFDLSVFEIFVPLSWGGAVILAANALELPELPATREVTLINTVPSAIAELARGGRIPPSVRTVNLAGEPLPGDLVHEIYRRSSAERVLNLYGPSEDTTYSTWALAERGSAREPTIGRPLPDTRAYVLDRGLRPLPVGAPGELCLAGAGLARGYLGRPHLTAERFLPDPLAADLGGSQGDRLYRTGDLARWLADGTLEYLGRLDHQVKIRGFRIELGEVEAELRRHPAVAQAVVAAVPETAGGRRLAAYVVPAAGATPEPAELREHLRRRLPEPMVPTVWVFLPHLPLNPNGKIDRKALPSPERAAAPPAAYEAPRSGLERRIAEIWQEVLGVERVGVHDNFFDLGGHSLLMAQVQNRLLERLGREVSMVELLSYANVASLARFLARVDGEAAPGSDPGEAPAEALAERRSEGRARLELLRRGGRSMDSNGGSV